MKCLERHMLTYVDYKCSRTVQYFSCYIIRIGSITIAYIIKAMNHMPLYAVRISLVVMNVVVQGLLRLAPPTRPSDERPPVMYGHICLIPRVSVYDTYYCILLTIVTLADPTLLLTLALTLSLLTISLIHLWTLLPWWIFYTSADLLLLVPLSRH